VKRQFSTGFPAIDQCIGEVRPGDSVLAVASDPGLLRILSDGFRSHSLIQKIPLASILPASQNINAKQSNEHRFTLQSSGARAGRNSSILKLRRFLSRIPRSSYLLVEEYSQFRAILRSDRLLLAFFSVLTKHAERTKSVLLITTLRSEFSSGTLAHIKDSASVCLELLLQSGDVYCIPVSLKARYHPPRLLPPRLRRTDFSPKDRRDTASLSTGEHEVADLQRLFASQQERYKELFDRSGDALVMFDSMGDYREFNPSACKLLDRSSDELRTVHPFGLLEGSGSRMGALRFLAELLRHKKRSAIFNIQRTKRKPLPLEIRATHIGGTYYLGILRDVSDQLAFRNEAIRQVDEYRHTLEQHPFPTLIVDGQRLVHANGAFRRLQCLAPTEEFQGKVTELFTGETLKLYQHASRVVKESSESRTFDGQIRGPRESMIDVHASLSPVVHNGRQCIQISLVDTSARTAALKSLEESEKRYRTLVEASPQAIIILSESLITYVNSAANSLLRTVESEDIVGKPLVSIVDDDDAERMSELLRKRATSKAPMLSGSFHRTRADGVTVTIELTLMQGPEKGVYTGYVADVTERDRMSNELAQRVHELAILKEVTQATSIDIDARKFVHTVLHRLMEVLSWETGGAFALHADKKLLTLRSHRSLPDALLDRIRELPLDEGIGGFMAKTLEPFQFHVRKYPTFLPLRSVFVKSEIESVCLLPLVAENRLVGMFLLASKQRRTFDDANLLTAIAHQLGAAIASAEKFREIRGLEEQFSSLVNRSSAIHYECSSDGKMTFLSDGVASFLGYPPREFYKNPTLWLRLVHPDDKWLLLDRSARVNEFTTGNSIEYRILPKGKATYRWVQDTLSIDRDGKDGPQRCVGTVVDVTALHERAQVSARDDELKTGILSSIHEGVVAFDLGLNCIQWSAAMEAATGITAGEAIGKSAAEIFSDRSKSPIVTMLGEACQGMATGSDELSLKHSREGTERTYWTRFTPLSSSQGSLRGAVGIFIEVTERKRVEHELLESEETLRKVVDTMGDALVITDLQGTVLQVNKTFIHLLGYTRAEALGQEFPHPWLLEEEMGRFVLWIAMLRERNLLHDFDMVWKTKSGTRIPMSISTTMLRNSMGEPIAMLNIGRNISDRVRLTKDLERRTQQIEMINRIIARANQTTEFDDIFNMIASEINGIVPSDELNVSLLRDGGRSVTVYAVYGAQAYHKDILIPIEHSIAKFVLESSRPVIVPDLSVDQQYHRLLSYKRGIRSIISFPLSLKDQFIGTLNIGSNEPFTFSEEQVQMLEPIARQLGAIIDRIQLFQQVTDDSIYIRNLLNSLDSIVVTVDVDYRIHEVNESWHDFMSWLGVHSRRDYFGLNIFDVLPDESLRSMITRLGDQLLTESERVAAQELVHRSGNETRMFQMTMRAMTMAGHVTGFVITQTDISALKRTQEALGANNQQLVALNEISSLIGTSRNLEEILTTVAVHLREALGAQAVLVYLRDQTSNNLLLAKQLGFDEHAADSLGRLSVGTSVTGMVVESRNALYIEEGCYLDERIVARNRDVLRQAHMEAVAIIPLLSKSNVLGALDIFFHNRHEFTGQEQRLLSLVGNQLGSAIENVQLYNELRSQIDRLTVLYELSQQLTSTLDTGQIFQSVFENVRLVVPFEEFSIQRYNEDQQTVTTLVHTQLPDEYLVAGETGIKAFSLQEGSFEWEVVRTRRPVRTPDGCSMYVPMLSKGKIIGILSVHDRSTHPYSDTHLRLLESVGNLAAIALEKGMLYEETVQKSEEIQRRNKELDDFTYVVSHDLKEPLISIEGYSKILQADYGESISGEGKEYLDSIVGATTRMKGLIDDLLMLSRVGRPTESYESVSIASVLAEIATDMEYTIRQRGVRLIIPDNLPHVVGNETQLTIVFRNLIGNAIKFNTSATPTVEVGFRNSENNTYLFSIRDNGIGIDKDFHDKIFVIFQRLHRREDYEGSGAGLAIVKRIVEAHHGRIWVESTPGEGSTFFFTIPASPTQES
jgi:PAS domain S-box-containing protein